MDVRGWQECDRPWLREAIYAFLAAGAARGGDLLPTARNVETYLQMGYGGAHKGDPCLVAIVNGQPVAFVLWVGQGTPLLEQRWKTIYALGSYTEPRARSHGYADELRVRAREIARALGYERIIGPVSLTNARGVDVFIRDYDAWPTHIQFEAFV